ncbi:MAG: hypothetical protein WBL96_05165 [Pseudolabrys sp.]
MNSKSSRYIKRRMGNDLKQTILVHNGIIPPEELKGKPSVLSYPRCNLVNAIENKYCSKCSYPLVPSAYDELKQSEERRIKNMEEQIQILISSQKEILEPLRYPDKLAKIF